MFASLLLSATLAPAAPVPRDTAPAGPAPYILNLRAAPDGEVKVTVFRAEKQKVMVAQVIGGPNGQQVVQQVEKEVSTPRYVSLGLADLKDLKVYTADGKEVAVKDAVKKANDGGLFVASADGQKVSPTYLKLFKDDVLVFVSPDLVPQGGFGGGWGGGTVAPGRPAVMPLPLVPLQPPAGGPGGAVQIQILPAIDVAPLPAVPPPAKKDEK